VPGPLPQQQHQRERDTKRRQADAVTVQDDGLLRGPELEGGPFSDETLAWYTGWRRAPQAALFESTDWRRLVLMAPLVEAYYRKPGAAALSEIRLNEEKLGALYGDRLRARIYVERPSADGPDATITPLHAVSARADAKARLRGVS
jgi:hypothetical protein